MSRYFVSDEPAPIYEWHGEAPIGDDGAPLQPNVIWIKARMDVETRGKVSSDLVAIGADGKTPEFRLGAQQTALLVHNIVRWTGPDLGRVPCVPENIRRLDPNEPHIARVLEEIGRRNAPRESPDPKSPAGSGSTSATESSSSASPLPDERPVGEQLATLTPRSALLSALDGRRSR